MPEGCVQRFDRNTFSFLQFMWQDRHAGRQRMAACRALAGERGSSCIILPAGGLCRHFRKLWRRGDAP